jgi:ribosomal protein S18 acetylase RimI-like enzyme
MRMIDCICGERLRADTAEQLANALHRHTAEVHPEWDGGEEMARSLVEMQSRMTPWDGTQKPLDGPVEVVPLTPERSADMLRFFDHDAFTNTPMWADCYCMYPHEAGGQDTWRAATLEDNRAARERMNVAGQATGLLAYADANVVGWCNAGARSLMPMFDTQPKFAVDDAARVGAITCFVVAPWHRGQGIAKALLDAACVELRRQGFAIAEAYPPTEAGSAARAHLGTVGMYRAAGFDEFKDAGNAVIMRRQL